MRPTSTNFATAETTTRVTESHYPRMPIGHSIRDYGQFRTTTELSWPSGILQKQDRTRIIYSKAIMADGFTCRKIELFGQIQFTLLGTGGRNSRRQECPSRRSGLAGRGTDPLFIFHFILPGALVLVCGVEVPDLAKRAKHRPV